MAGWEDQWARVQRYLQRLIDAASGYADLDTMRAVDDAKGFFQSIHHLKDWLRHDPNVTLPNSRVTHSSRPIRLFSCVLMSAMGPNTSASQDHGQVMPPQPWRET